MVEQLLDADDTRPIKLYWGVRHQDLAYWSIPEGWRSADRLHVEVVVSEQADWSGRKGWVHQAVLDDIDSVEGWSVFSCGAPPMIEALKKGLEMLGLESNYFYSDPFLPAEAEKTE
jgi:CDP-4-dehydro-6-deoxyglucose reductase